MIFVTRFIDKFTLLKMQFIIHVSKFIQLLDTYKQTNMYATVWLTAAV